MLQQPAIKTGGDADFQHYGFTLLLSERLLSVPHKECHERSVSHYSDIQGAGSADMLFRNRKEK